MATIMSPNIPAEGLRCFIDATNIRSYPGTGNTIYDLSGNGSHGSFINGATYSSDSGGVVVLDGTNDYIDITCDLYNVNFYTVIGASKLITRPGGYDEGRTFSGKNSNWLLGHWAGYTNQYYADGFISQNTKISDLLWTNYAGTGDKVSDSWGNFANGQLIARNNAGSNGPLNFAIGSYVAAGEFSNAQISYMLAYTRVLSDIEIKQCHNALKSRFGL
jgi:hypothetical protein